MNESKIASGLSPDCMSGRVRYRLIAVLALMTLVASACGGASGSGSSGEEPAENETPYYADKRIDFIVPLAPGGGNDAVARLLAAHLPKHIAGNPTIVVHNIEGGGGLIGATDFNQRPSDGTALLIVGSSTFGPILFRDPAWSEIDVAAWQPIFASSDSAVALALPSTGLTGIEDMEPEEPLFYGAPNPYGARTPVLLSFNLLGLEVGMNYGYDGSSDVDRAFQQGELNMGNSLVVNYADGFEPMVETGDVNLLYSLGVLDDSGEVVRDPEFPDLPTTSEVYEEILGEAPSGDLWDAYKLMLATFFTQGKTVFMHGDAPPEAIAAIQAAMEAMGQDDAFLAEATALIGEASPIITDTVALNGVTERMRAALENQSGLDAINEWLASEHGVDGS